MNHPSDVAHWIKDRKVAPHASAASVWADGYVVGGDIDTYFDLASLTKPILALAVLRSGLDIRAPISRWIPEIAKTPTAEVPLELLLSHRAGLAPHLPLHEPLVRGEKVDVEQAIVRAAGAISNKLEIEAVYSDLGYMLAGVALARSAGAIDAGQAMKEYVLDPLELDIGCARDLDLRSVAPTEDVPWRGGVIEGQVHDENAWALTGLGASGHAGLFGTITGVAKLVAYLMRADLGWMVKERPGGTLRAGFDGKSTEGSSAGTVLGPKTFGHLGFTGTSFWIDPEKKIGVVLLTNRVHPTRSNDAIRAARPTAHDALARIALQSCD